MTVAPPPGTSALRPLIYVRSMCATATDVACIGMSQNVPRSLRIPNLTAGNYFLVVDGSAVGAGMGTAGAYTFSAFQGTPPGESCMAGTRIVDLSSVTSRTFAGDTTGMAQTISASCAGMSGPNVVYEFTASRAGMLTVTTRATFDIALAAHQGASCDTTTEVACSDDDLMMDSSNEAITRSVAAGQTVWFWVVGYDDGDFGAYQITFTLP